MIRTGNKSKTKVDDQIRTSKGRTILEIAMSRQHSDIVRYLVNEKNISIYGIKDIQISLAALEGILKTFPTQQNSQILEEFPSSSNDVISNLSTRRSQNIDTPTQDYKRSTQKKNKSNIFTDTIVPKFQVSGPYDDEESSGTQDNVDINISGDEDISIATTVNDVCIICYEQTIDCVITPCGHQVCCLKCSEKISKCPLCHSECQILKIFKP